eukprot:TRINITY_DN17267_c0_g3_i1.p1 TRINITY_DN17267_c0_g3~~TRINITY_DN17267_c0_g3_i1.p1  ORF type:complete len:617 (+),score=44.01 TRINITY_DN17267_c0_g3_i1:57-1907(+)
MSRGSTFRLWLHAAHGGVKMTPLTVDGFTATCSVDERLSMLSDVAKAHSLTRRSHEHALTEVLIDRGRLVAASHDQRCSFDFPLLFSLVGSHRDGKSARIVACAFMRTPSNSSREQCCDGTTCTGAFGSNEVWILVVTPHVSRSSVADDSRDDCDDIGTLAALARYGAICRDFLGHQFPIDAWMKKRIGCGSTAEVTVLQNRPAVFSHGHQQCEQPTYALKCFSSGCRNLDVLRETNNLLQVQGHQHISRFMGLFRSDTWTGVPKWLMLMEAYPRGDLQTAIGQSGPFAELEALSIMDGVLRALAHIHALCIIHGDVKLENIVLRADGTAVLIDFGLSVHTSEKHRLKRIRGTPGYISPEILLGRGCTSKSDVFSCGVVFYGILSGGSLFKRADTGLTRQACVEALVVFPEDMFALVSNCPRALIKMMPHVSSRRRPSAKEASHLVERCAPLVTAVNQNMFSALPRFSVRGNVDESIVNDASAGHIVKPADTARSDLAPVSLPGCIDELASSDALQTPGANAQLKGTPHNSFAIDRFYETTNDVNLETRAHPKSMSVVSTLFKHKARSLLGSRLSRHGAACSIDDGGTQRCIGVLPGDSGKVGNHNTRESRLIEQH